MTTTLGTKPQKLNFYVKRGIDFDRTITFKIKATGNPRDLTDFTARMMVREAADSPGPPLFSLSTTLVAGAGIILGGTAGTVRFIIPNAITEAFDFDDGLYDFEFEDGDGKVSSPFGGKFQVGAEITRPDITLG